MLKRFFLNLKGLSDTSVLSLTKRNGPAGHFFFFFFDFNEIFSGNV